MATVKFKCNRCADKFSVEVLEKDDPRKRQGSPVQCRGCGSTDVKRI